MGVGGGRCEDGAVGATRRACRESQHGTKHAERLCRKQLLRRSKIGHPYCYTAGVKRGALIGDSIGEVIACLGRGELQPLVSSFIEPRMTRIARRWIAYNSGWTPSRVVARALPRSRDHERNLGYSPSGARRVCATCLVLGRVCRHGVSPGTSRACGTYRISVPRLLWIGSGPWLWRWRHTADFPSGAWCRIR